MFYKHEFLVLLSICAYSHPVDIPLKIQRQGTGNPPMFPALVPYPDSCRKNNVKQKYVYSYKWAELCVVEICSVHEVLGLTSPFIWVLSLCPLVYSFLDHSVFSSSSPMEWLLSVENVIGHPPGTWNKGSQTLRWEGAQHCQCESFLRVEKNSLSASSLFHLVSYSFKKFFFVVLGFEFRALCLLGRCSTARATHSILESIM
jgi:hypothetical protein